MCWVILRSSQRGEAISGPDAVRKWECLVTWYYGNFYLRGRKIKAMLELLVQKYILNRRADCFVTLLVQSVLPSMALFDHCLCTLPVYILFINPVCYVHGDISAVRTVPPFLLCDRFDSYSQDLHSTAMREMSHRYINRGPHRLFFCF